MASQFTYAILTGSISTAGSIRYWVQHSEIPVDQILEEAQRYIFSQLRVREMRSYSDALVVTQGQTTAALPSDFQDPISLKLDGDSEDLDYVQENLLGRLYDDDGDIETGRPNRWTIFDEAIQFDVEADDTYNARLVYYGTPDLISATTAENFLSTRYPTVLRRACLAYAYEHRKLMEMFVAEVAAADKAIEQANMTDDMGRRGQILR